MNEIEVGLTEVETQIISLIEESQHLSDTHLNSFWKREKSFQFHNDPIKKIEKLEQSIILNLLSSLKTIYKVVDPFLFEKILNFSKSITKYLK